MKKQLAAVGGTLAFVGFVSYYQMFRARKIRAAYPPADSLIIEPDVDLTVTRDANDVLHLRWRETGGSATIYAGTAPDVIDHSRVLATVENGNEAQIGGLDPATRYYFEVALNDGRRWIAAERILPLSSAINFRDIGGYRTHDGKITRWGRVYRTGSLANLSDADLAYFGRLGVRIVCDLRAETEAKQKPDRLPHSTIYWLRPVSSDRESSSGMREMLFNMGRLMEVAIRSYTERMIAAKGAVFGEILHRLSDPANQPMLIHCSAGKDRTGVSIALLLGALGVPDETIVADYSISNRYYEAIRDYMSDAFDRLKAFRITPLDLFPVLSAHPDLIRAALNEVRSKHGTIENYLISQGGLDKGTLQRLRDNLLVG